MSRRDRTQETGSKVVLPITPMLDMSFQLLFFFIFNFNPADLEGAVDMSLPTEADKAAHKKEDIDRKSKAEPDPKLEFPSEFTVIVRTRIAAEVAGEISAISVKNLTGKEDAITGALKDGKEAPLSERLEELTKYLRAKQDADKDKKDAIKLQGDGKLHVNGIVKVMDACRAAGFPNISFVPPEDFGR
jgi:biopolymer transport protein ExbD